MSEKTMVELLDKMSAVERAYDEGLGSEAAVVLANLDVRIRARELDQLAEQSRWRTMESAPKDEVVSLAEFDGVGWDLYEGYFDTHYLKWFDPDCKVQCSPNRWRPLPEPPKEGE